MTLLKSSMLLQVALFLCNGYHQKVHKKINAGEDVERRETSYTLAGNVNWYSHCGELYGSSLKN